MMGLGENVRQMRLKRGMTQEELAQKIDLTRSQISNIEKGKRATTYERQIKLAAALNCDVGDLYDEGEKIPLTEEEQRWIVFNQRMKEKGYSPEELERWLEITEKFMNKEKE